MVKKQTKSTKPNQKIKLVSSPPDLTTNSKTLYLNFDDFLWPIWTSFTSLVYLFVKVNSVQKACAKCFVVHILRFEILQITWKKWEKNIRPLVFSFLPIDLACWCFLFYFFMRFARFQILISQQQSIWRKLLVLSWLYRILLKNELNERIKRHNSKLYW